VPPARLHPAHSRGGSPTTPPPPPLAPAGGPADADGQLLSTLTGVRSGKQSYYAELKRTKTRLTSAVQALERISAALVRTRDDPRALLGEMLRAAAAHLQSDWTMIAVSDAALPGLGPRFLATGPQGQLIDSAPGMPGWLRDELASARAGGSPAEPVPGGPGKQRPGAAGPQGSGVASGASSRLVRVPLVLDGAVLGRLVASYGWALPVDDADLWVLHILANQAAVSMHTATLHSTSRHLQHEAQQLYDKIARSSDDLRERTAELARAEIHLQLLHDRELLDAERHRIALDLHDSVAQYVLSAGLAVDVCRAEASDRGEAAAAGRLLHARDLIAKAQDQVRSAVFALHHTGGGDEVAVLPELLQGLTAQHRPGLAVALRLEGRPYPVTAAAAHGLARIAGEALFNSSLHAGAARAIVRLRYGPDELALSVSDDGQGDPATLRKLLRLEAGGASDGRHQGLAGMAHRVAELGGTFAIRRSKLGGVRIEARVPAAAACAPGADAETDASPGTEP
jgi:signal transduction histidine kinase